MIYRIVLAGGPCSGKSTCLQAVSQKLKQNGYYVITVPETASEIIKNVAKPRSDDYIYTMMFQDCVFKTQLLKEKTAEKFADVVSKDQDVVILYDRSLLDNVAYLPRLEDFHRIVDDNGEDYLKINQKYDLVIDLLSIANQDESKYIKDDVRMENPDFATQLDKMTTNAYLSVRNLQIVEPTETIEEKIDIVEGHIDNLLEKKPPIYVEDEEQVKIDSNDRSLYEVDADMCIAKYTMAKNTISLNGYTCSLIKKMQARSKPIHEMVSYDEVHDEYNSTIISESQYLYYREKIFNQAQTSYIKVIRYVKDNELHQLEIDDRGVIKHTKLINNRTKEKSLVKK